MSGKKKLRPGFKPAAHDDRPPSRSQKKRDATALQDLGERLLGMGLDALRRIDMPEDLRAAVIEARGLRSHEARRRHLQFIGSLMRQADPEPIRRALNLQDQDRMQDSRAFQRLESWRNRLVDGDESVLAEVTAIHPQADAAALKDLAAEARRERAKNLAPKAFRALFRALRSLDDPDAPTAAP